MTALSQQLSDELDRRYDGITLIGSGGMGAVYRARERSLDRDVAIKVLSGAAVESAELRDRFRREARIAARLVHPNIVPLHAFGETAEALYLVMGFVDGPTLAPRLERGPPIRAAERIRILTEIADALAFAHREGVVHRDVKPENILLEPRTGRALLADFGIARISEGATTLTLTGVAVGTPAYMSPEQALASGDVDGRSDIYSLGVVGYRMLAGRLPFKADGAQQAIAQHVASKPADLALSVAPGERATARAIMRALEKDPSARWARVEDLRAELIANAQDEGALPEELANLQAFGPYAVLGVGGFTWLLYVGALASNYVQLKGWGAIPLIAGLDATFGATLAWMGWRRARQAAKTFGWRESLRTMFHPPKWWPTWWPRSLRRADEVWSRLPAQVRRWNISVNVAVFVGASAMLVISPANMAGFFRNHLLWWFGVPSLAVYSAVFAGIPLIWRAFKTAGATPKEAARLASLPTAYMHPDWKKPQFARILSAPVVDTGQAASEPPELVQEIRVLSKRLASAGFLEIAECGQTASDLAKAIAVLDAELARLRGALDPAEAELMERRVAAAQSEPDEEIRALMASQQAVWDRLKRRVREKEDQRQRLHDMLRTVWMQLVELDARITRNATPAPELAERAQALSEDIRRAAGAIRSMEPAPTSSGARQRADQTRE